MNNLDFLINYVTVMTWTALGVLAYHLGKKHREQILKEEEFRIKSIIVEVMERYYKLKVK